MATAAWGTDGTLPRPVRPIAPAWLDPNDPVTFIGLGADMLRRGRADSAAAAFYWASRIDPTLAIPYYGRSVALLLAYGRPVHAASGHDFWVPVSKIPMWRLAVIDSLRSEALARDPFMRAVYDHLLTGRPALHSLDDVDDPAIRGYWMYDFGYLKLADSLLGVALTRKPDRSQFRDLRARAEYALGRYDSAVVQLHVLLDTLSHRDSTSLTLAYSSKELIYYALGDAEMKRGDTTAARIAFEDAIGENAAFYPAHSRLGALALSRNDRATAFRELALATEVAPNDPALLLFHATTLLDGGDAGQAVVELLKAIDLDPYFAKPYLYLGKAQEARGDPERAAQAYEEYAAHARSNAPESVRALAYADTLRRRLAKTH
jgi:tetratricopeptide (TPR) repeat protein